MADPQMSTAFVAYLQRTIEELRTELAAYEDGTAHAGRRTGDEWVDITVSRSEQIRCEIEALQSAITCHKAYWGKRT